MKVYFIYLIKNHNTFTEYKLEGFTNNKKIADGYKEANNKLSIKEIIMNITYDDVCKAYGYDKEIKCFRRENSDEYIFIRKCDKQKLLDEGVILYDSTE